MAAGSGDDEAKDLTCFVIGPIGDKDAEAGSDARQAYEDAVQVLEEVIEPACAGFGIPVTRADRINKPGEVTEQIYRNLRDAHLVIADLTGANPNVMYELGLRHTSGKLTIQIGERGKLPFDVNVIRTILFKRTEGGIVEARRRLSAAIAAGLESGGDPVTATRVWFESSAVIVSGVDTNDLTESGEELGFLEKLAEMTEALDSATTTLNAVTTVFHEIGSLADATTLEVQAINAAGGPASARVAAANRLATLFDEPATKLAILAGDYARSLERMDPGIKYSLAVSQNAAPGSEAADFRANVSLMIENTEASMKSIEALRSEALATGDATRSLRQVNRRIVNSLNQLLSTRAIVESWRPLLENGA